jgi:hypothetical protein
MQASKGDEIIVPSQHVGQPARHGKIVEVRGESGGPPYVVRWDDTSEGRLFFPGSDTMIEPHQR